MIIDCHIDNSKGHAVVVVAEGAGEELLGTNIVIKYFWYKISIHTFIGKSAETDAGGNRKLPAIGEFLKQKIIEYFKADGQEATVKYIGIQNYLRKYNIWTWILIFRSFLYDQIYLC